ncbi:MAG: LacI family DNA-binding transcriptional regulator [Burkholderiales bacterium]|nr:LacI family DNA-binding transcriptional regulator [Phycisphaerae bacterium]
MIYVNLPKQRPQPITLEEVATRAGVSAGTVSRVLNGKNKENRPAIAKRSEKIRQIALDLGYRPNAAARSMLRGAFRTAAFVTCGDPGIDWYPITGLNGIHAALTELDWRLIYNEMPASQIGDPDIVPQLLRETAVDGLIVNLLPYFVEETVDYFEAQPLPCVWLNIKREVRSVYPDERTGGEIAVESLTRSGHKRIGFFSRSFGNPIHYSSIDRLGGFQQAIKLRDLSSHRHLPLQSARPDRGAFQQRAEQFLSSFPDVDSVICYESAEVSSLTVAAERIGRRVPDVLEIIGFSERNIHDTFGMNAKSLIIPFHETGRQAVNMLQRILETGNRDASSIAIPYSLLED